MKIAFFSPLPPQKSGIAVYNAQLLPHLAQHADITLFNDKPEDVASNLKQQFSVRAIQDFAGPLAEDVDICLYQMGNNIAYHASIYKALRRYPGIVTLHDINIHSFYGEMFLKGGDLAAYTREMAYAYGQMGANHARRGHQQITKYNAARYPLFDRIADLSLGVIVHSQFVKSMVASRCRTASVTHIPLHQPDIAAQLPSSANAKERLGYAPEDIVLSSFGYISPNKHIDAALQAIKALQTTWPRLRYALVGKVIDGYNIAALIADLNLEGIVTLTGYVDDVTYRNYLAATDVGINLRHPTQGETSSTLLSLMAAGKPVLVSDVDAFSELPDAVCLKITAVSTQQTAQLETTLQHLLENPKAGQVIGQQAKQHIHLTHRPEIAAKQYIEFIKNTIEFIG